MVVSQINSEINYKEKRDIEKKDLYHKSNAYEIEFEELDTNAVVISGKENNTYIDKNIIYFPLYLVLKSKKGEGSKTSLEKIGLYEIDSTELLNILDED